MPELDIPEWVPEPVGAAARQLWASDRGDKEAVQRLAIDPRMKRVWDELKKNKQTAGWPATVAERESRAAEVFRVACQTLQKALPRRKIESARDYLKDDADKLDDVLASWRLLRPYSSTI